MYVPEPPVAIIETVVVPPNILIVPTVAVAEMAKGWVKLTVVVTVAPFASETV